MRTDILRMKLIACDRKLRQIFPTSIVR